jgi:hypothetical protein
MRRDISLNEWQVLGAMAAVTLGMYLGILRLALWVNN